jgi:hypothetical protein
MHYLPDDIVYREFEKQEYFYIVRTGVLAVEKQIEVQYSNLWPTDAQEWNQL